MPEYLAPGVFIEETSFRAKSIEGVATSTAGFIGPTLAGPAEGEAQLVTSFAEFVRLYGTDDDIVFADGAARANYLARAGRAFFENGGKRVYVARVFRASGPGATGKASVDFHDGTLGVRLTHRHPGLDGNRMKVRWDARRTRDIRKPGNTDVHGLVPGTLIEAEIVVPMGQTLDNVPVDTTNLWVFEEYDAAGVPRFSRGGSIGTQPDLTAGPVRRLEVVFTIQVPTADGRSVIEQTYDVMGLDVRLFANVALLLGPDAEDKTTRLQVDFFDPTSPAGTVQPPADEAFALLFGLQTPGRALGTAVEPFDLDPGDTLVVSVNGGAPATATFMATAASRETGNAATFALADGQTLTVRIDGRPVQTISFLTAEFAAIGAATAAEVAAVINAKISGARATVTGAGMRVTITSDRRGTTSGVNVTGGTANGALAFATGNVAGGGNVADVDAVTVAEVKSVVQAAVAGVTVSNDAGRVSIASNSTGTGASIQVQAASTADDELGLDNAVHSGGNAGTLPADADGLRWASLASVNATASVQGDNGLAPTETELEGDGTVGRETGLFSLEAIDDVAIIAAPGETGQAIHNLLISHCERLRFRFAILDPSADRTLTEIRDDRARYDTTYGALYYPWVRVPHRTNPNPRAVELLPPSGFMAGIYARSDVERGVHKAPANEVVRGALGFEFCLTQGHQEVLNPEGINALRFFEGRGNRAWGARTLSSDPEWKYINVRRLFIFLEHSLDRGLKWVVFEPNNEKLWARVRLTITAFLTEVWRTGALLGSKPEEAFFVKCDRTTMTQSDLDNGRLVCLVGVAPTKPAEFVIIRIGQFTADAKLA